MDPDPVCPERLVFDPINIRPDPKPWGRVVQRPQNLVNSEVTKKNKKGQKSKERGRL